MASILVIAHPGGGTSGVLEQAAQLAGAALEEWSPAETTQPSAAIDDYDGLVVLGGGQISLPLKIMPRLSLLVAVCGCFTPQR